MEHRDKRSRLGDEQKPADTAETNRSPSDTVSALSTTKEGSVATSSAGSRDPAGTAQDTDRPQTSQIMMTPDKSTWQGWAEIENDPVCLLRQTVDYRVGAFPDLI